MLAHPLRARLLAGLRSRGTATATDLAADLGTNSGATSYHLRQLAAVGLVRDVPGGRGRRRLWEATPHRARWLPSELADDDDLDASLQWLDRDYVAHFAEHAEAWLDAQDRWPARWRDGLGFRDGAVLVTADQQEALRADLDAVLEKWARVGQGNPTARRVAVYTYAYPIDPDRPPREPSV
ncbi:MULTISPECIES: helix-turn-helix domain-containing protein [unclassified Janibacter]|uniref:helix-turn-helix domain-containing protein n=1 Tax=unclassified Janibacter TaxID=2649294 RepID=UPI003D06C70D